MAYIYLGYVLSRVPYRCSTFPKRYFFFVSIFFTHAFIRLSLSLLRSLFPRSFSLRYFRSLFHSLVVAPCRQHLQRSSLFPLGCSEPFVMILRIHGSKGMHVYLPEIIPHSLKLFLQCPLTLEEDRSRLLIHFGFIFHALML